MGVLLHLSLLSLLGEKRRFVNAKIWGKILKLSPCRSQVTEMMSSMEKEYLAWLDFSDAQKTSLQPGSPGSVGRSPALRAGGVRGVCQMHVEAEELGAHC